MDFKTWKKKLRNIPLLRHANSAPGSVMGGFISVRVKTVLSMGIQVTG